MQINRIGQSTQNTNFKGIVYPARYSEQLDMAVKSTIPDSFVEQNPKYAKEKQKGPIFFVKKLLKINQPEYIVVKNEKEYSCSGGVYGYPHHGIDENTLYIHNLHTYKKGEVSRPAHEEEKAVFEKLKQNILEENNIEELDDKDFFNQFSVKYERNEFGEEYANTEEAIRNMLNGNNN